MNSQVLVFLFPALLIGAGGVFGLINFGRKWLAIRRTKQAWKSTEARLLAVRVAGPDYPTQRRDSHVEVDYEFEVDGQTFKGSDYELPPVRHTRRRFAEQSADRLSRRQTIPIFYNPQDPAENVATLDGGAELGAVVFCVIFLGFVFVFLINALSSGSR
jgi:hypothetical protein